MDTCISHKNGAVHDIVFNQLPLPLSPDFVITNHNHDNVDLYS